MKIDFRLRSKRLNTVLTDLQGASYDEPRRAFSGIFTSHSRELLTIATHERNQGDPTMNTASTRSSFAHRVGLLMGTFLFLLSVGSLNSTVASAEAELNLTYPQRLIDLGVPPLPDAQVIEVSRVFNSQDGGFVVLESALGNAGLRTFYEQSLAETEWTLAETRAAAALREKGLLNNLPFLAVFTKPGWRLHCLATTFDDARRLKITLTPRDRPASQ